MSFISLTVTLISLQNALTFIRMRLFIDRASYFLCLSETSAGHNVFALVPSYFDRFTEVGHDLAFIVASSPEDNDSALFITRHLPITRDEAQVYNVRPIVNSVNLPSFQAASFATRDALSTLSSSESPVTDITNDPRYGSFLATVSDPQSERYLHDLDLVLEDFTAMIPRTPSPLESIADPDDLPPLVEASQPTSRPASPSIVELEPGDDHPDPAIYRYVPNLVITVLANILSYPLLESHLPVSHLFLELLRASHTRVDMDNSSTLLETDPDSPFLSITSLAKLIVASHRRDQLEEMIQLGTHHCYVFPDCLLGIAFFALSYTWDVQTYLQKPLYEAAFSWCKDYSDLLRRDEDFESLETIHSGCSNDLIKPLFDVDARFPNDLIVMSQPSGPGRGIPPSAPPQQPDYIRPSTLPPLTHQHRHVVQHGYYEYTEFADDLHLVYTPFQRNPFAPPNPRPLAYVNLSPEARYRHRVREVAAIHATFVVSHENSELRNRVVREHDPSATAQFNALVLQRTNSILATWIQNNHNPRV